MIQNRGLESAETEVEPVSDHRAWKRDRRRVTRARKGLYDGTAVQLVFEQSEILGDLVESFAGGVVDGGPHQLVGEDVLDVIDAGVPARSNKRHVGRMQFIKCHFDGVSVCFYVVYGDEGFLPGPGERLCRGRPDEKRTHETGTVGDGDSVDVDG